MPFRSVTVKQDEKKTFVIAINRGRNYGEGVVIKLAGLPAGVTLMTGDPVIEHASRDASNELKMTNDRGTEGTARHQRDGQRIDDHGAASHG